MTADIDFPRQLTIGKKRRRAITIYPLSLADQQKFLAQLASSWNDFVINGMPYIDQDMPVDYVEHIYKCLYENIETLLEFVTEGEDVAVLTSEITNSQQKELLDHVWEQNFSDFDLKKKTIAKYLSLISVEI